MFKKLIVTLFFLFLISFIFVGRTWAQEICDSCGGCSTFWPFCGFDKYCKAGSLGAIGCNIFVGKCCYKLPTPTPTPVPPNHTCWIWNYGRCGVDSCSTNERCDLLGQCAYDLTCVPTKTPTPTPIQSITIIPSSTPTPPPPSVTLIPTSTLAPTVTLIPSGAPTVTLIPTGVACSQSLPCPSGGGYTCLVISQCGLYELKPYCNGQVCLDGTNVKCCSIPPPAIAPPTTTPSPTPTPTPTLTQTNCKYVLNCTNSDQCAPLAGSNKDCVNLECNTTLNTPGYGTCMIITGVGACAKDACRNNACVEVRSNPAGPGGTCTAEQTTSKCTTNADCIPEVSSCLPNGPTPPPGNSCAPGNILCTATSCGGNIGNCASCPDGYKWCYAGYCIGSGIQPNSPQASCPSKSTGDANCDTLINDADFQLWKDEYTKRVTTLTADFNQDGKVNMIDFDIWRRNKK